MVSALCILRRAHRDSRKNRVANVDANFATAVRTTVVVVFTWLFALAFKPPDGFTYLRIERGSFLAYPDSPPVCRGFVTFARCRWARLRGWRLSTN